MHANLTAEPERKNKFSTNPNVTLTSVANYVIDVGERALRKGADHQENLLTMQYRDVSCIMYLTTDGRRTSLHYEPMGQSVLCLNALQLRVLAEEADVSGKEVVGVGVFHELGHLDCFLEGYRTTHSNKVECELLAWERAKKQVQKVLPESWKGIPLTSFDKLQQYCIRSYSPGAGKLFQPGSLSLNMGFRWKPEPGSNILLPSEEPDENSAACSPLTSTDTDAEELL